MYVDEIVTLKRQVAQLENRNSALAISREKSERNRALCENVRILPSVLFYNVYSLTLVSSLWSLLMWIQMVRDRTSQKFLDHI